MSFNYDGIEILSSLSNEEAQDRRETGEFHDVPTLFSLTKTEAERNEANEEKTLEQEELIIDSVMDSPQNGFLISDANKWNNAIENEGNKIFKVSMC